jgi:hypothetical protein
MNEFAMRYYILLLIFSATVLYGQVKDSHFIKRPSFQTGAIFQRWTSGSEQRLDEIVVPLLINYPVSERFSVSLLNTPTRAEARRAKQSSKLTAFTDTKISTALVLGEERALLNFGVSIPSGLTALNASETVVAQAITEHALDMATNYFGGGWDVSASIAAATEMGKWIFGGSIGGVYRGQYVPTAGSPEYQPGPEISVSAGFDRPFGESNRVFGDIGYIWYGKDKQAGQKVLQAAGKINFSFIGIVASQRWQATFSLENDLRRKSPFVSLNRRPVSYGNELDFSVELARQMNRSDALLAVTGVRVYGKNALNAGDATITSLGPGWRGAISPSLQMEAVGRFSFGSLNGNRILGGEVSLGFALQF